MPDIGARKTRLRIFTPPMSSGDANVVGSAMHKNQAFSIVAHSLARSAALCNAQ
ncbi:hypothetical protein ACVOMV_36260 [Mesorhizobium atlanticum]